jgi:hypothetical protein
LCAASSLYKDGIFFESISLGALLIACGYTRKARKPAKFKQAVGSLPTVVDASK